MAKVVGLVRGAGSETCVSADLLLQDSSDTFRDAMECVASQVKRVGRVFVASVALGSAFEAQHPLTVGYIERERGRVLGKVFVMRDIRRDFLLNLLSAEGAVLAHQTRGHRGPRSCDIGVIVSSSSQNTDWYPP
jgi:hypothetical protein